ncbi:DUF1566 domain-containing protein [Pseudomonas sp. TWR3-1-1]|uniref:DUF1566 domain-containing protein n=1 Tax=Pseudomonas sp. TWR3-1-1 TaxID=2804633 RepID=UPI003CEEAAEB
MKPEMITLKHGDTTIKMPAASLAKLAVASVFAQVLPPAANVQPATLHPIPELGAVWPGQGGFNGGLVAAGGEVPAHYLIIAAQDAGSHEWGGRGRESQANSKRDGFANTVILMEDDHPAANKATAYTADGHDNFYLPAAAELYHCWLSVPDLFAKDTWYWSSTQRSANNAFNMYFDGGSQYGSCKGIELRVRPVRRLFI